jgi:serine/threonine protein kinase
MADKRYPRQLSHGANNSVVALSTTEAGKLFTNDTRSDIGSEAEKMRFANGVNSLVVRFERLDIHTETGAPMLVMERLYPMDFRAYEQEHRELWLDVFRDELTGLHKAGFAHRDLRRPSNIVGAPFDNIFLTAQGLRLIDVGISALRTSVGDDLFTRFLEYERAEVEAFATFFLER